MADALYRLLVRTQGFSVEMLHATAPPFHWREYTPEKIRDRIKANRYRPDDMSWLDLAIIIHSVSGDKACKFFALASEARSQNLVYEPERANRLLKLFTDRLINDNDKPKERERKRMDPDRLYDLFTEAFTPIRQKLGWGDGGDTKKSYNVTEDVIKMAASKECKEYLGRLTVQYPHIFPDRLQKIAADLARDYPLEGKQVLDALKKTGNRRHFASLSLTDERGELMVCLANHHKQRLRVEAWKFALLLESPAEPKMLAQLERLDYRERRTPFLFNDLSRGDVHAMFFPDNSVIRVICKREEDKLPDEQATFYIEPDYALSLYLLLTRMRQDQEQFTRLWEEATVTPKEDLFDSLYIQH